MNWFLYDREVCHERVDRKTELSFRQKNHSKDNFNRSTKRF